MSARKDRIEARKARAQTIEVEVLWGDAVLGVTHLSPPRACFIGESDSVGEPVDWTVPEEVLGCRRAPLIVVDEHDRPHLVVLSAAEGVFQVAGGEPSSIREAIEAGTLAAFDGVPGAALLPLTEGTSARLSIGTITLKIESMAPIAKPRLRRLRDRDWVPVMHVALAMMIHVVLLGVAFYVPTAMDEDGGLPQEQYLMVRLAEADEKELARLDVSAEQEADPVADNREGGTGTRAKGEEGTMGNPSARATGSRYGVAGPADGPNGAALGEAAEFGMIGILNSGGGGDPNAPSSPWGRDDSLGGAPLAARGNQWGDSIGDSAGAGNLGLSGIGAGGGGRGEGIGLGSIGTLGHGAGTGRAQGFGAGHGRLSGSHRASSAPPRAAAPEPVREAPIDPNGRFATTYRPGGGHLAAFDAAVASGILPATEREVVADLGGGFAPELPLTEGKALSLGAGFERAMLSPSGGDVHLRLALRGTAERASERPHLSVHLVLDTSGSMDGESIEKARKAALALVSRLAPTDDFSLVTFESEARVLVPDGPVGPRRALIRAAIGTVKADGGTNIGEGLRLGYAEAQTRTIPEDAVRVVLLLSDGRASAGVTRSDALARLSLEAFQHNIQTSTIGVGSDYDGALMSAIAADGAGGYYYVRDSDQIGAALATELDRRLDPIATAVELRVRLKSGVDLLKVYGSRRLNDVEASHARAIEVAADQHAARRDGIASDRQDDAEGGMRFLIPAFARGDAHALLLKLRLPEGVNKKSVATIELKYKDRVNHKNVVQELPLSIGFADSDAASAASADLSVASTVQAFIAGESLLGAAERAGRGDRQGAAALLYEREQILREAAKTLSEPRFITEANRLARLRAQASPEGAVSEPLALAMLLETAGRSRLH